MSSKMKMADETCSRSGMRKDYDMRKRFTPILLTGCLLLLLWTAVSAGYAASGPLTWQVVSTATAVPTYVPSESADRSQPRNRLHSGLPDG